MPEMYKFNLSKPIFDKNTVLRISPSSQRFYTKKHLLGETKTTCPCEPLGLKTTKKYHWTGTVKIWLRKDLGVFKRKKNISMLLPESMAKKVLNNV